MLRSLGPIALLLAVSCAQVVPRGVRPPQREKKIFSVRWAKNYDSTYLPGNLPLTYGGVASTPELLFVGALDGGFEAIDVDTGRVLWHEQETKSLAMAPMLDGELVYYGTQTGRLIVRQQRSGELKYAIDLGAPIESAPLLAQGRLFVYLRGHQLVCLDAATGKIIWNYRRAIPVTVTLQRSTRPLVVKNSVIVGFADGFVGALSLQEGSLLWEQKIAQTQKFMDVDLNPVLMDGLVVTGPATGDLVGLDPASGAIRRRWPVQALSHPLLRPQSMVVGTSFGEVAFLGFTGEVLKKREVSKAGINHVMWWKDHVIAITLKGTLLALDPLTLDVVDRFELGHDQSAVFGDVALSTENLGVLTSRNRVFFFQ